MSDIPRSDGGVASPKAEASIGHELTADALEMGFATAVRAYAAALYETLHRLDRQGFDWIAVERPPDTPEWAGVLDRLQRAAV